MNDIQRDAIERRNREYTSTRNQRRRINALLRDGYDTATGLYPEEDFQVTLYTDDLLTPLTDANDKYFAKESTRDDMNKLFGHIAAHSTIHIDALNPGYRVSLLRELPNPGADAETEA